MNKEILEFSKVNINKHLNLLILLMCISLVSCNSKKAEPEFSDAIRINQIGFYPNSVKQFVVADVQVETFAVVNEKDEVVYTGKLINKGIWNISGEQVFLGDFSSVISEGKYYILIDNKLKSYSFQIKKEIYTDALNAAIKSFYFQRASMPIEEQYGGVYSRKAGMLDDNCLFHPSSGHSVGSLNSPGGWFDAGDYGKYVVNASFSVGQMLHLVEEYPNLIADGQLNIPESGNGESDLMNELKYELNWILTMQDTDGGVYHKLTAKNFSGFIMPEAYNLQRMIIGKGTAATLNFAAVLAQAVRLESAKNPEWSQKALIAAEKAWEWAVKNPKLAYKNPEDVVTGPYDDILFSDDFYWAATELYLTTRNEIYLNYLLENKEEYIHQLTNSWKFFVRNNAFHSLIENKENLNEELKLYVTKGQIKLADEILEKISKNPYKIALETFEWGSNSDILNQAMILCFAHKLSNDEKYLIGAEQINDYIFGKNATRYSFLTGYGSKQVKFPHHRISGADGVENPIPGFIVGGPNKDKQDSNEVKYLSSFPAKAYVDVEASYASNEVCLNWNAPAIYVLGYLQQHRK
ncbi:glycoside hydrolase family 9 protein [Lutibacter sp.]|uniref:glycoside hydrolase family 9 protein n=1 Tax=Lutibacter sp. TaxID=1925666 RepID=UPI001A345641|nr:glycoside hydrolase family 9 protein [Lutibacter sp.]MBI9042160.1 glycoside hydrolase family 9 protein [Lutibacter sp.]